MDESKELEGWLSVREASELTGYSTEYIRNLARSGAIKSEKVGYAVLIDREDLERYYKDKKTQFN
jgi:excisionase family DNA binding protein